MTATLKGGTFQNRYLIKATLRATAPFHIGSGETTERKNPDMKDDKGKLLQISAVVTDNGKDGKAYIPGSSIRGAIREWLGESFTKMEENLNTSTVKDELAKIKDTESDEKKRDEKVSAFIQKNASTLERLFGSQHNEGKLEVWDAFCTTSVSTPTDVWLSGWRKDRLTYVAKSVAIDPETGTAAKNKLYNFELVPEGATFAATFTAQNLSSGEEALLMAVLEGFNDTNNPITLGSMTKRGFGSFKLTVINVYRMDSSEDHRKKWRGLVANGNAAGYDVIAAECFKHTIAALPKPDKAVDITRKTWNLTLETPLVIRSGGKFGWKNSDQAKSRNCKMQFRWGKDKGSLEEIGDLYFSLRIVKGNDGTDKVEPYYHVPSSSIRGPLREWAITHLLPKDLWDVETHLKGCDSTTSIDSNLHNILNLFGFAVDGKNSDVTKEYTRAGRLTIRVTPFSGGEKNPAMDGSWANPNADTFGPSNAKRHVKPRNPLDRISHAAKDGALHNSLEFSKGETQKLTVTIEITPPNFKSEGENTAQNVFDNKLLEAWKCEINQGMIRFGGLTSIGRGRVSVKEETSHGKK